MNVKEVLHQIGQEIMNLRNDALQSEEEIRKELLKANVPSNVATDKDYWNGYLDALDNVKKELQKVRRQ